MEFIAIRILAVFFIFFIGISAGVLSAQAPMPRHFEVEDGLASARAYFTLQDRNGFIWIGTEKGVSRFDGYTFKNFTIKDGLSSNDVWGLHEDGMGRIWLSTFNKLTYIYDDQVVSLDYEEMDISGHMISHIITPQAHHVRLSQLNTKILSIDKELNVANVDDRFSYGLRAPNYYLEMHEENHAFFSRDWKENNIDTVEEGWICISGYYYEDREKKIRKRIKEYKIDKNLVRTITRKDKLLIFSEYSVSIFNQGEIKEVGHSDYLPFDRIESVVLIFGTEHMLIRMGQKYAVVDQSLNLIPGYEFLNDYNVNSCFKDRNDNFWICTNEGVFLLSDKANRSGYYSVSDNGNPEIFCLAKDKNNRIWMGGGSNGLYVFDNGEIIDIVKPIAQNEPITDLVFDKNDGLTISAKRGYYFSQAQIETKAFKNELSLNNSVQIRIQNAGGRQILPPRIKSFLSTSDGDWISFDRTLFFNGPRIGQIEKVLEYSVNSTFALEETRSKVLLLGQANGIYELRDNAVKKHSFDHPVFSAPINDLEFDDDENLWIATDGLGLYRFKNNELESIEELEGQVVKRCYIDLEGSRIWSATNEGVGCVRVVSENPFTYKYTAYTTAQGLISNEINDIEVIDNQLFVASRKGFNVLDIFEEDIEKNDAPIYITNIAINGRDTQYLQEFKLDYNQNNIALDYVNLSYQSDRQITYFYKMVGIDDDWKSTKRLFKEYPNLTSGTYTFLLKARDINGQETEVTQVKFEIAIPWWERKSLWWLGGLFCLGIFYLINKRIVDGIKNQAEEQNRINQQFATLELQALQAQMNPHFIFNALHAIQDFIFRKDERTANHYLVKFSRLMRLYLESTKEKVIILEEELKLLRLYVELEELRFENKFETQFIIDPELTIAMVEIPSMILQPFVENAINHGLLYKEEKGNLKIEILRRGNNLICAIEDNGVGRARAAEIKAKSYKGYKSRGMGLVTERTKIFNLIERTNLKIEILDLKDENKIGIGTRVEVSIPLQQ